MARKEVVNPSQIWDVSSSQSGQVVLRRSVVKDSQHLERGIGPSGVMGRYHVQRFSSETGRPHDHERPAHGVPLPPANGAIVA